MAASLALALLFNSATPYADIDQWVGAQRRPTMGSWHVFTDCSGTKFYMDPSDYEALRSDIAKCDPIPCPQGCSPVYMLLMSPECPQILIGLVDCGSEEVLPNTGPGACRQVAPLPSCLSITSECVCADDCPNNPCV